VADYVGYKSDPGYGDIAVSRRGNTLELHYYQNIWTMEALPIAQFSSKDLFFVTFQAFGINRKVFVTFNRTPSGAVDKLSIPWDRKAKQVQFIKR
jgi:hypothetical protein